MLRRDAKNVAARWPGKGPPDVQDLAQLHTRSDDRQQERVGEDADEVLVHLVLDHRAGAGPIT